MKKVLLLVSLITIVSCNSNKDKVDFKTTKTLGTYGTTQYGREVQEITIDGCQYIGFFDGSNADWGTHKGNCNNPIHKQNKVTVVDTVEYKLIRE